MTYTSDATEMTPRMRPYKAVRLTEDNINDIAHALVEYTFTDPDGNIRMSCDENSIPIGWWAVWHKGPTIDCNFYSDYEFHAMYEEKGANANRWPTEHLIILLDASYEGTLIDCPDVAMRTSTGNYMLSGGDILGENNSVIRNYAPATAMRIDDATTLLAKESESAARPAGRLASEAWDLIHKQNMMNLRTKP